MHILYPLVIGNWICRNCLRKKKVRRCAPLKWDKIPILVVGGGRKCLSSSSAAHPPLKWETSHIWGVSHVHGVQRPISLEYQIIHPPKVHNTSYTLVTGMSQSRLGDSFRQCYLHLRWLYFLLHEFRSQMCHAEEYSRTGNREFNMIRNT